MRKHHHAGINAADFRALKEFERRHPELYQRAPAPNYSRNNAFVNMSTQANAFNAVFNSEAHKEEIDHYKQG